MDEMNDREVMSSTSLLLSFIQNFRLDPLETGGKGSLPLASHLSLSLPQTSKKLSLIIVRIGVDVAVWTLQRTTPTRKAAMLVMRPSPPLSRRHRHPLLPQLQDKEEVEGIHEKSAGRTSN